jgi:hypothetical protein
MKTATLAKAIERDLLRERRSDTTACSCFACGRTFMPRKPRDDDDNVRFCSKNCQEVYDNGMPRAEANPGPHPELLRDELLYGLRGWKVVAGTPGVEVGLLYYAEIIERCDRKRAAKAAGEDLIRPRHLCERCGAKLPVWIKGKKVPVTRRFCAACKG